MCSDILIWRSSGPRFGGSRFLRTGRACAPVRWPRPLLCLPNRRAISFLIDTAAIRNTPNSLKPKESAPC